MSAVSLAGPLLDGARSRAEVDWIDVRIRTTRRTNFNTIRERVEQHSPGCFVTALEPDAGGSCDHFVIRLQDPPKLRVVESILSDALSRPSGKATPIEFALLGVDAIEVAVDFYQEDENVLHGFLEHFVYHLIKVQQWHHYGAAGRPEDRGWLMPGTRFRSDVTYKAESWDPNVSIRAYKKVVDAGVSLPRERWRCRVEMTIGRESLPETWAQWRSFRFEDFTTVLQTWRRPDELSRVEKLIGRRPLGIAYGARLRQTPRRGQADSELNGLVRTLLKNLTSRFIGNAKRLPRRGAETVEATELSEDLEKLLDELCR